MPGRFIDHVDLRVRSFTASGPLYDAFLGALGMHRVAESSRWIEYGYQPMAAPYFALTEEPGHQGSASRIAFAADSRGEVDRVGAAIRDGGWRQIEGPDFCPEYHPGYYAVFFEDPDGNRFEVCCHTAGESDQGR